MPSTSSEQFEIEQEDVPSWFGASPRSRHGSTIVPVFTLVLWMGCLAVGLAGFVLPYFRPHPPAPPAPPMTAAILNVQLTTDLQVPSDPTPPPPQLLQPPPLAQPQVVPPAVPMIAVATPSPQIAFAVPIEGPARVVPPSEASLERREPVATPPNPQPLTFGQGEGKQPAPEYPRPALRQGQEGVVIVRMTVGPDGRVLAAEASTPAPWPLLNEAAVRVVRSRWRFSPGPIRAYEVAIRFQLNK